MPACHRVYPHAANVPEWHLSLQDRLSYLHGKYLSTLLVDSDIAEVCMMHLAPVNAGDLAHECISTHVGAVLLQG